MRYNELMKEGTYKDNFKFRELSHELRHEEEWKRHKRLERMAYFNLPDDPLSEPNLPDFVPEGIKVMKRDRNGTLYLPLYSDDSTNGYLYHLQKKYGMPRMVTLSSNRTSPPPQQAPLQQQVTPGASDIKMTHLHYFQGLNDTDAQDFQINQGVKLKKDRNGKWYLPQYNKSGGKFQKDLQSMTRTYGSPNTVTLK